MTSKRMFHRPLLTSLSLAALLAGTAVLATPAALAGECPADKIAANPLADAQTMPEGVTDEVLSMIDLSKEKVALEDRLFRLRRLEIQPGGIVPLHSHDDRPALIYIVQGTVEEYNSTCSVPIVHRAGEAAHESIGLTHWWKNTGDEVAILLSADILHTAKDDAHTM